MRFEKEHKLVKQLCLWVCSVTIVDQWELNFTFLLPSFSHSLLLCFLFYIWTICEHFQHTSCWSFTLTRILILCIILVSPKTYIALYYTGRYNNLAYIVSNYFLCSQSFFITNIWGTWVYCVVVSLPPPNLSQSLLVNNDLFATGCAKRFQI